MAIELFEHNQTAYESAVTMLTKQQKAAIVHPTGTGKSFIGFKLCEDNPDKTICWLSPSRYIYQTQIENLKEVSNGYEPKNVNFYTYAKLMLMSEEELAEIQPDYIILDEFHRCGAELWGTGVHKLLNMYSNAYVLGLSATAIRYLDNQRNMTEELFDGNIASEMTLGEAIVRGILQPPKYVLSIFSYQKDLEEYEKRVKNMKNARFRDTATEYLEALRRALNKADKLDILFEKHMTERNGKYIVFCANRDHMRDMIDLADEWFAKVDSDFHIYKAYSSDPETSKAFADFKADTSNHLKLLYCIDMLNEGVHVDDISGVILLRPTLSPIIYKQQIGRALSASGKNTPVIFDIVNNVENLYSINAVKEEMEIAVQYFHEYARDDEIVNDTFEVNDEIRECVKLFEALEESLTFTWDVMYAEDIPTPVGPWKLQGLPGLIMSATDSEGIHSFTLVELYIESLPIIHENYFVLSIPTEGGGSRPTIKRYEKRTHEQMVTLRNKIFGAKVYPSNPQFSFPVFGASDVETTILNDDCLPNATLINGITILGKAHKFQPLELK